MGFISCDAVSRGSGLRLHCLLPIFPGRLTGSPPIARAISEHHGLPALSLEVNIASLLPVTTLGGYQAVTVRGVLQGQVRCVPISEFATPIARKDGPETQLARYTSNYVPSIKQVEGGNELCPKR